MLYGLGLQIPDSSRVSAELAKQIHPIMAKKTKRILTFPTVVPDGRPLRLQYSALFWQLTFFLLPSYAVWQGLYQRHQIWFSLILWGLATLFLLFFIDTENLKLRTREPRSWPGQSLWQGLCRLPLRRRTGSSAYPRSIFGDYANDGKGGSSADWNNLDEEGISIEQYLRQRHQSGADRAQTGFDWNWRQNSQNTEEVWEGGTSLLKKRSRRVGFGPRCRCTLQKLRDGQIWMQRAVQKFCSQWSDAWLATFPQKRLRFSHLCLFIGIPFAQFAISYWWYRSTWSLGISQGPEVSPALRLLQLGGFVTYGKVNRASFYAFLFFLNLSFPLLSQQLSTKLFRALRDGVKSDLVLRRILGAATQGAYTLAFCLVLLLLGPAVPAYLILVLLLSFANLYLRLQFRSPSKKRGAPFLLLLFCQLSCLSWSLGLLAGLWL